MGFKFEKPIVWQKVVDFSSEIHELTKSFPKHEIFIHTSQIKRAADSVSLNFVEVSTGQLNAEFRKFIGDILRSNIDVVGCINLTQKRKLIDLESITKMYKQCE